MPVSINPEWQHIALYAVGAAILLLVLQRLPVVGRIVRFVFSLGLAAFCIFLLIQHAPFEPHLARLAGSLGLDRQEVVGKEVRIRMAPDGHFWADVSVNGIKRRMLIDSGATITAISERTASAAGIAKEANLVPIMLNTANGVTPARTGTVEVLRVGNIRANDLKVVISPSLGSLDVLGMNFMSKLQSWRVENNVLVLVPHHPQPVPAGVSATG
jgi:aspartyl protease family protein